MQRPSQHRRIARNSAAIGLATAAYALGFGALGTAAHLSVAPTCVLALLLFSGASQLAYVGSVANPAAAVLSALLLGLHNGLSSLGNRPVLRPSGATRLLAARVSIDRRLVHRDAPWGKVGAVLRRRGERPPRSGRLEELLSAGLG